MVLRFARFARVEQRYNYTFFQLECLATHIPWNWIEINYLYCHLKLYDRLG